MKYLSSPVYELIQAIIHLWMIISSLNKWRKAGHTKEGKSPHVM